MSETLSESRGVEVKKPIKKPIKKIAWFLHHREYPKLTAHLDVLVKDHGWREVVTLFKKVPIWTEPERHIWAGARNPSGVGVIPVRRGKFRDGLLRVLGLEAVSGIDVDLLQTFGAFRTVDPQTLRERAMSKASRILKRQIERGTTFFLDTEKMAGTPLEALIPDILEQREKELLSLGDRSTPSKISGTYYGLSDYIETLTKHELKIVKGLPNTPIRVRRRRPSYRRTIFKNCSEDLADLLLNLLRAALAVPQALERAAVALGVRGDLRAIGPLTIGLERAKQSWRAPRALLTWSKLSWALSEVGFVRSNLG